MAFRKSCSVYVSGTTQGGFVTVRKVGLELSKIHTHKIKKYPYLGKFQFVIDLDHF